VRDRRGFKLVSSGELFELTEDPGESRNVASGHPEVAGRLRWEFEKFFTGVTASQDYRRVPIQAGREDENPVEIDLTWGDPVGRKVRPTPRHYNRDTIDDWSEVGDSVRWRIEVVRGGRYEVTLEYGCRPEDAGSRLGIWVGGSQIEHRVEATAGRDVFRAVAVGVLKLAPGEATLEMKPVAIVGREVMALHNN
jgi:hypothetical protein